METYNSDYKQYIKELQDTLSGVYFGVPIDELHDNSDQESPLTGEEITQLEECVHRLNNIIRIENFTALAKSAHQDYEIAKVLEIDNEWVLDSRELFEVLNKMPNHSLNRVLRYLDCDNAAILTEIDNSIRGRNFEQFHDIIKENSINTATISKILSLFDAIYDKSAISEFLNAEDELDRIIATEQIQKTISCVNDIIHDNLDGSDRLNKIIGEWLIGEKLADGVDLVTYLTYFADKASRMYNQLKEAESVKDYIYRINELAELCEPNTLKNLATFVIFNHPTTTESYIITKALDDFGMTSKFEDCLQNLSKAWESARSIWDESDECTFAVPSDLFSNLSYISDEGATNHFDGTKLRKAIEPEALEKLINYLAIHNYIGNSDTEKYRLLYYITGKVVNSNVDYTGKLAWIGEATVIYNIVKNLFTGKGHYKRVRELVNFVSDKHGAERLEKQHIEKPGGMSGFVDIIADDDYKRFVGAAFKWTFKGDLKK